VQLGKPQAKMSDLSEAEVIKIANNFLLNAPPGEFLEVVTDVRALLPNESILNKTAARTFREYNTEQMVIVEAPRHDHKLLITKYGEVADGEYLDPKGKQIVQYDHIRQAVSGAKPLSGNELSGALEPLRAAFEKEMFVYVGEHYPSGATTVYTSKDQQTVLACTSAARFNSNNFWNGRWRVVWTFNPSNNELSAHFKTVVHYYEDGNVQLNTDNKTKLKLAETGAPDVVAKAAVAAIKKAEASYHSSLEACYATMGDTTYKALRRALPITRQKIDWVKIRNYKIGNENK